MEYCPSDLYSVLLYWSNPSPDHTERTQISTSAKVAASPPPAQPATLVPRFKIKTQFMTQIQSLTYNPLNTLIKYNPPTCTLLQQHRQAKHEVNFHKQTSSPHRSKKWFVCYIPMDCIQTNGHHTAEVLNFSRPNKDN